MLGFRSILTWLATVVAVCFITPLIEPVVEAWLTSSGYYEENWLRVIVSWVAEVFGETAAPYLAGGAAGLAVGMWLSWGIQKLEGSSTGKPRSSVESQRAKRLDLLDTAASKRISDKLSPFRDTPRVLHMIFAQNCEECVLFASALSRSLQAAGIECNAHSGNVYRHDINIRGIKIYYEDDPRLNKFTSFFSALLSEVGITVECIPSNEKKNEYPLIYIAREQE